MRIVRFEDLQSARPVKQGFRSGDIDFHDLMTGTEGSKENFGLQLVSVAEKFSTPQHRHNFEQVRVMLDGSFGFGGGQVQHKGSVGYFCEGTYYTQAAEGASRTLLLQIGGPSGQGFMSRGQLRAGIDALSENGKFEDGIYTWHDANGKKHNQDSYEAAWEHVHGLRIHYPKPQYSAPVLMDPARYNWLPDAQHKGVSWKELGCFNGHGLRLAQMQIEAGAEASLDTAGQALLMFCLEGAGAINDQPYARWTTCDSAREVLHLKAGAPSVFFVFGLPDFRDAPAVLARKKESGPVEAAAA